MRADPFISLPVSQYWSFSSLLIDGFALSWRSELELSKQDAGTGGFLGLFGRQLLDSD